MGALLLLLPVSIPSIRYTQGKQEGIRMGPDRHLVCWEISLGRSERLPSPLPDSAHQMWGEGHIARSLCSAACSCSLSLCFASRWRLHTLQSCSQPAQVLHNSSPLLVASISIVVQHYPPQVRGHQLLLLLRQAQAGQLQLAGAALRQAELPVWNKSLLELVPVLQTAWYLQGRTHNTTYTYSFRLFMSSYERSCSVIEQL